MAQTGATLLGAGLGERRLARQLAFLGLFVGTAVFAVFPILPLFSQNQNTKFLQGLARAGYDRLQNDWLVKQGTQFPIFDVFVWFNQTLFGQNSFYVWQWACMVVYTAAMLGIARFVGSDSPNGRAEHDRLFWPILGAWFVALNLNATFRVFEGVAHQYINSRELQPQSFGVLALLGLLLFRFGYGKWSAALIVVAAWIHPAFVIPGVMLFAGMAFARWRFGREAVPIPYFIFALGAVGCLGAAAFSVLMLPPMDPVIQAQANRIVAEIRIPHHSFPEIWFDRDAIFKSAIMAIAIILAWRDPLGSVLLVTTGLIVASSFWVLFTHDLKTALVAPWRASSIIVPAAVAIVLGKLTELALDWARSQESRRKIVVGTTVAIVGIAVTVGLWKKVTKLSTWPEHAYFSWVREHAQEKDVFLTPVDQMDFRLATRQPQYISWKSNAFFGRSALDWYARVLRARAVTDTDHPDCAALDALAAEGVTHLVRRAERGETGCPAWSQVFNDGQFTIAAHKRGG